MNPGRLENRCTVFRETETKTPARDVVHTFAEVGIEWLGIEPLGAGISDVGPGERATALGKGTARPGARIQLQDVLRVDAGPMTGMQWRVVGLFPVAIRSVDLRLQLDNSDLGEAS